MLGGLLTSTHTRRAWLLHEYLHPTPWSDISTCLTNTSGAVAVARNPDPHYGLSPSTRRAHFASERGSTPRQRDFRVRLRRSRLGGLVPPLGRGLPPGACQTHCSRSCARSWGSAPGVSRS